MLLPVATPNGGLLIVWLFEWFVVSTFGVLLGIKTSVCLSHTQLDRNSFNIRKLVPPLLCCVYCTCVCVCVCEGGKEFVRVCVC